jgi:DNA-directed RNA polymerase specialized sigma24 family protein
MSTRTLLDTQTCFEKQTLARRRSSGTIAKDGTEWREIAWEALHRMTLADMLRLAFTILVAKYGKALFLQDVDNPHIEDTALILDIPVVAVQSRLR